MQFISGKNSLVSNMNSAKELIADCPEMDNVDINERTLCRGREKNAGKNPSCSFLIFFLQVHNLICCFLFFNKIFFSFRKDILLHSPPIVIEYILNIRIYLFNNYIEIITREKILILQHNSRNHCH